MTNQFLEIYSEKLSKAVISRLIFIFTAGCHYCYDFQANVIETIILLQVYSLV